MSEHHSKSGGRKSLKSRYADFLPEAQALQVREPAPLARALLLTVVAAAGTAIGWAGLSTVDQVATAPAVIRPDGRVKTINHPEGGRVVRLAVTEGQTVRKGTVLVEIDPVFAQEEILKREGEWQALSAEVSRLEAELSGDDPAFDPAVAATRPNLVETQKRLLAERRRTLAARHDTAEMVVRQRKREAAALAVRSEQLVRSLTILKDQQQALQKLADKGYFPRIRYLSIQRQVSELEGQVLETMETREAALSALAEARTRRVEIDGDARADLLSRLADARRERDVVARSLQQERGRLTGLAITAPADGVVQELTVTAPGQSVRANEPIMQIVPTGESLIVEARVSNADIGYIAPGQEATVKLHTYDFVRYGALSGTVTRVAPDATEDQATGERRFRVLVRTDKAWLGEGDGRRRVNPGMEADVDLHIGKRSILSYLTDRLQRTTDTAFRER